jgi:hypothetical protein
MSELTNGNGRAEGTGAPAKAWEKTVETDRIEIIETASSAAPASHDPKALHEHLAAGHELIPLRHWKARDSNGKPMGKAGLPNWRRSARLSFAEAEAHMAKGGNIGVRLRPTDLVIDVDPRHFAEGDDPMARLIAAYDLPEMPFVRTGGGGWHHYLLKPADAEIVNSLSEYLGIEFKSQGRQVVAAGSIHPDTGQPYVLDDDPLALLLREAPEAPTALLDAIGKPSVTASADTSGEFTPEQLEKLLSKLDVAAYSGHHDEWLKIMMACHHGTAGLGIEEFVAWSVSDPDYAGDEADIRRRWNSLRIKPGGVRINTLLKALSNAGHGAWIEQVRRSSPQYDFLDKPDMPQTEADLALASMNKDHFTVLDAGKHLVGRERIHPTLGHLEVNWFPASAISAHFEGRMVETDDGKTKPLGAWWVKHPRRRQYDGVVFDPAPHRQHARLYNLWKGWAVMPKPGDWSLMKRLLRDVLCAGDAEAYDYVVRWSAFMVQQPHVPAEVALVFKGSKGVGKGSFARALRLIAGAHGKQVAQPEHFVGKFNEHLMDCILLFVDEGYWAGDPKAAGAVKNLITEPVLSFEPKGRPIVSGPNMLHVVIASNEAWVVPATADERRFAVFEADTEARNALPPSFFIDLNAEMENGGLSAMLHDLLTIDLAGWHPRSAIPNTKALVDQKVEGFKRDPLPYWWFRLLESGSVTNDIDERKWSIDHVDLSSLDKEQIVSDVNAVAKSMGRPGQFTKKSVASFLKLVGVEVDAKNKRGERVWRVPHLGQARHDFEVYIGGAVDWDGA